MSSGSGARYHGGFSWSPNPGFGELTLNDEFIELSVQRRTPKKPGVTIVKVFFPAIASVEVTSERGVSLRQPAALPLRHLGARQSI
jgi:hypothetical protein